MKEFKQYLCESNGVIVEPNSVQIGDILEIQGINANKNVSLKLKVENTDQESITGRECDDDGAIIDPEVHKLTKTGQYQQWKLDAEIDDGKDVMISSAVRK